MNIKSDDTLKGLYLLFLGLYETHQIVVNIGPSFMMATKSWRSISDKQKTLLLELLDKRRRIK